MVSRARVDSRSRSPALTPWFYDWKYVALLLVILITLAVRVRLLELPLERDEGEYAYMGQLILQGVPPYAVAYNMKLPGTYAAYALVMAVFGQTIWGIHMGLLVINAATVALVALLGKRVFDPFTGAVAGATYAVLSVNPTVLGLAAHATHFVVLPALGGVLLLLQAVDSGRRMTFFLSGLLLGLAFLMKQPGIFFTIFAVLYLVWTQARQHRWEWKDFLVIIAWFSAGCTLPVLGTLLALWLLGVFEKFWFWAVAYAVQYGSRVTIPTGAQLLMLIFPRVVGPFAWLWVAAGVGLLTPVWDRAARTRAALVIGFLLFSVASVSTGLYFRSHYFILMLPAMALLVGMAVSALGRLPLGHTRSLTLGSLPFILYLLAIAFPLAKERALWFHAAPNEVSRQLYGANPFPESLEIARYIKAHSTPRHQIAVFGSEPQIYFYAERRSATGYIYTYSLVEEQRYALQMQQEMIREVEQAEP